MFHSRVHELAQKRNWGPYDLMERTNLSLNTCKHWLYVRKLRQINMNAVLEFSRLFNIDDWRDLFYPTVMDALTDAVYTPNDTALSE